MAKRIVRFDDACIKVLQACRAKFEQKIKPEPWLHCLLITMADSEYAVVYVWDTRKVVALGDMMTHTEEVVKKLGIKGEVPPETLGLDVAMLSKGLTDVPDSGKSLAWSKEQVADYGKAFCINVSRQVRRRTISNPEQAAQKLAKLLKAGQAYDDDYKAMIKKLHSQDK